MHKKVIILLACGLGLGAGYWYFNLSKKDEIHYHAGFEIYNNEILQDFSDIRYMDIEPCTESEDALHKDEILDLHDGVGNIVHVHDKGATWGLLLTHLKQKYPREKIRIYINDDPISDGYQEVIQPYDAAVIFIGEQSSEKERVSQSMQRLTRDYIVRIEKKGESCTSEEKS